MKKRWVKPQLVVLVRGKPEESVLGICKTGTAGEAGPSTDPCQAPVAGCGVPTAS